MNEWKDTSSYSRTDTDRVPNSFTRHIRGGRLCVHRHRDYPPDTWVASFYFWGSSVLDCKPLLGSDLELAKAQATVLARVALKTAYDDLGDPR